jgi:hypothetical protein
MGATSNGGEGVNFHVDNNASKSAAAGNLSSTCQSQGSFKARRLGRPVELLGSKSLMPIGSCAKQRTEMVK